MPPLLEPLLNVGREIFRGLAVRIEKKESSSAGLLSSVVELNSSAGLGAGNPAGAMLLSYLVAVIITSPIGQDKLKMGSLLLPVEAREELLELLLFVQDRNDDGKPGLIHD